MLRRVGAELAGSDGPAIWRELARFVIYMRSCYKPTDEPLPTNREGDNANCRSNTSRYLRRCQCKVVQCGDSADLGALRRHLTDTQKSESENAEEL